ncbi:fibronectin type III domain-containing protein [Myroides odoratus]|uniref:fibronectin type III domain-containing protein n=1 Tax=Myroides odoratus TaxID=256 RepID=UPI0039AEDF7B
MKRITVLFFFLLSIVFTYGQEVTIGTGTVSARQPLSSHHGFARSAALYTSTEVGQVGFINQLAWDIGAVKGARPIKIYLKEVESTTLIAANWATFVENATLVYDGSFTPLTVGFNAINLDASFNYTGGNKNLLVLVETNFEGSGNGDGVNGLMIKSSNQTNMHFEIGADNTAPIANLSALASRPNLRLTFGTQITCPRVNATVNSVTATNVNFSVSNRTTTTALYYEIRTEGAAGSGATGLVTSGTFVDLNAQPFTITGLTQNTRYSLYVRANCGTDNVSTYSSAAIFTTRLVAATLPYIENFEGDASFAYTNHTTNKWHVGNAANNGGTKALYISNDNGTTNAYTTDGAQVSQTYKDINIPTGTTEVAINFDWRCVGEGTSTMYDYFRVWIVPTTFTPTAGTQITAATDRIRLGRTEYNGNNAFLREQLIQNVTAFAGQTMRLVFEWRQDGSGGTQPPAAIDNLEVSVITCSAPTNLQAVTSTATTATVSWTAVTGQQTYEVYYSTTNTEPGATVTGSVTTTNNPYTIPGLAPNTSYFVWIRTICSDTDKSFWKQVAITTGQIPAQIPYVENFEGDNNWSTSSNSVNKWVVGTAVNNGGTKSLYVSKDNGTTNTYDTDAATVAHVYRDIAIPTGTTEVGINFDWRCVGEGTSTMYDYFRVWVVPVSFRPTVGTQITAATDRIRLGRSEYNGNNAFLREQLIQNVTAFAGQTMRLVFEWRQDGSGGTQPPAAIDNLEVSVITCSAPTNLQMVTSTATTATVSWTGVTGQQTYEVYYSTTNTEPGATVTGSVTTTDNPYTIPGLNPNTQYFVWIRTICSGTDKSFWKQVAIMTGQIPAQIPYVENFEGDNNWSASSNSINKWVIGTAVNNGGTKSLYVSKDNGTTNTYDTNVATVAHVYRDIDIPTGTTEVGINFDWRCVGEGTSTRYDYFRVWLVPTSFRPIVGTQITAAADRIRLGRSEYNDNATFLREQGVQNVTAFAGQTMRLVFEWRQDGSGGTQPPAAIDNLEVSVITCSAPTDLQVVSVTGTTATISWTGVIGQNTYEVYYATTATPPGTTVAGSITTTDNPYTIPGLTPNTEYFVWIRTICSDTDKSFWKQLPIVTGQIPAEMPYEEGFEGNNNWSLVSNSINKWVVGTAVNNGGTRSLYVSKDDGVTNTYNNSTSTVAHAYRDIAVPVGAIEGSLSFDWRALAESCCDYVRVWVVPATFRPTTGQLITAGVNRIQIRGNYNQQATFASVLESVDLRSFSGRTMRLIFEWRNDGSGGDDPAGAIDNVKFKVETCPSVTGLTACIGSDRINYGWDSQAGRTQWEIAIETTDLAEPNAANILRIDEPQYSATGLTVNTDYYFYVRNICGEGVFSMWKKIKVKTNSTNILDAEPFCAGPEGIIFPNRNDEDGSVQFPYGENLRIACLGSVPYPVWYFLKVDQDGDLVFDIIQSTSFDANGVANGRVLDVDFVAFGPFDNLDQACSESILGPCPAGVDCPNNTNATSNYPVGNIIDCSYDFRNIETLTINNAVRGQIYAVLITNFGRSPGFIKLVQRNAGQNEAGTTDCKFLCEVDLGEDQYLCSDVTSYEIVANITAAGSTEEMTYTWFKDDVMLDPALFNTRRIVVTETGKYRVKVEKDLCEENPEDEVYIKFYDPISLRLPQEIVLCDLENVGYALFDIKSVVEEAIANHAEPETIEHKYYHNLADFNADRNAFEIEDLYQSAGDETIYIGVSRDKNEDCRGYFELRLKIKATFYPNAEFSYEGPICINNIEELPMIPGSEFTPGGIFTYVVINHTNPKDPSKKPTGGLILDKITGTINVAASIPGEYDVKYYYGVPSTMCGEDVSHTVKITIFDRFQIVLDGDCFNGKYYMRVIDVLGNIDMDMAKFTWQGPGGFTADTKEITVTEGGDYRVYIETKDGCYEEQSITLKPEEINCLIPKGISPNGDGLNDYFDLSNYKVASLKVFNRNGAEVYTHGLGYKVEWMGQDKSGNKLPSGTYYYVIETLQKTITGWVQINY